MKKIYFIFPILFCFMFLFLPTAQPVWAEEDNQPKPTYEVIEITTTENLKDLVSLYYDNNTIYFTDGVHIMQKNLSTGGIVKLYFKPDVNYDYNTYYNIIANNTDTYFAQDALHVEFVTNNTTSTSNNPIAKYRLSEASSLISFDSLNPKKLAVDVSSNVYIIASSYIFTVDTVTTNGSTEYFATKKIDLQYQNDDNTISTQFTGGGFAVNEDGTEFYYSVDSTIYKITLETETTTNEETQESTTTLVPHQSTLTIQGEQITSTITHISVDCLGNLFVLSSNSIYKLTPNGTNYTSTKLEFDFDVVDISFDFCTGKTYAIVNVEEEVVEESSESEGEDDTPQDDEQPIQNEPTTKIVNKLVSLNVGFVTNYAQLEQENYDNFTNAEAQTSCVELLNLKADTPIYAYQSLKTFKNTLTDNKTVIKLGECAKFYYVLDTNSDINPYFQLCYVPKAYNVIVQKEVNGELQNVTETIMITDADFISPVTSTVTECKVMVAKIRLYNFPLSVAILDDLGQTINYAPNSGTVNRDAFVKVCNISVKLPNDSNNTPFVLVKFTKENQEYCAYIDSRTIINKSDDNTLKMIPVSNARLRVTTTIYADEKLTEQQDELVEGANVTVLHKSGGVARIQYYVGNELKTGYLDKNLVDDGSLTTMQMIGLCVASGCVLLSIILAIVISKKRKKQKYQA